MVAVLAAVVAATGSAFTAKISNTAGTAKAATWFTCRAAAVGDAAFFAYPLNENPILISAADVSGNNRTGTYQGLPTHSTATACARDPGGSATFSATTSSYVTTSSALTNPQTLTSEIWFNTTTTTGGLMIGFANTTTTTPTALDRVTYLTNAGNVAFGIYNGATITITSAKTYNDGTWHHAAATLSSAGMRLYVDGALVGSNTSTTAQNYTGYWRIANGDLGGWTNPPSSRYFTGSLSYAAVYTTALSATQITAHYTAGLAATTTTNTAAIRAATTLNPAAQAAGSAIATAHVADAAHRAAAAAADSAAGHRKAGAAAPHRHPGIPRRARPPQPTPPADVTGGAAPPRAVTTPRHPGQPRPGPHQPGTVTAPADPRSPKGSTGPSGARGARPSTLTFTSPSRNINCALTATTASCSIRVHTWTPPPSTACRTGQVATVQLPVHDAAALGCASPPATPPPSPPVLSYGRSITGGPFTCTSEPTAMTCQQAGAAHGFTLAGARYLSF